MARYDVWLVRNQCGSLRKSGLCGTLYVIMAQAQALKPSLGICCRRREEVWFLEIGTVRALKQTWHERKSIFLVSIAFPRTSLPFLLACACTVLLLCPLANRDFLARDHTTTLPFPFLSSVHGKSITMPTDEERIAARQDWAPEYPSGDEKRFPGSQAEQEQNQRTVVQQKKHNEFYNQEKRQTGKRHSVISAISPSQILTIPSTQVYKPSAPDPHPAAPEERE